MPPARQAVGESGPPATFQKALAGEALKGSPKFRFGKVF